MPRQIPDEGQQFVEEAEGDDAEPEIEVNDLEAEPFTRTRSEDGLGTGIAA
jgi:hypothetical protein